MSNVVALRTRQRIKADTSPAFESAWAAFPETGRLRSSKRQAWPVWCAVAREIGEDDLAARVARYVLKALDALERAGLIVKTDDAVLVFAPGCIHDDACDTPPQSVSRSLRAEIYARDGHACVYCGSIENLSVDHVVPRSKGGGNEPENLSTACMPCNISKRDRDLADWLASK